MSTSTRQSEPYQCLNCGNTAPMYIRGQHSVILKESDDQQIQLLQMYDLLECPMCNKPTLRSYMWLEPSGDPMDVVFQRLYPQEPEAPAALPDTIKRAYLAAERIKCFDPNAYGVLAGRMLELVAQDQGSVKTNLDAALVDLKKRKIIPEQIFKTADRLKDLRHIGGHAGLGSLTKDEVPILSELCSAIIFHLYVIPALINKADATIKALRKIARQAKGRGKATKA